jgi:hypothetical protein
MRFHFYNINKKGRRGGAKEKNRQNGKKNKKLWGSRKEGRRRTNRTKKQKEKWTFFVQLREELFKQKKDKKFHQKNKQKPLLELVTSKEKKKTLIHRDPLEEHRISLHSKSLWKYLSLPNNIYQ